MNCPGKDADSYQVCVDCKACWPGLQARVSEILEICFEVPA